MSTPEGRVKAKLKTILKTVPQSYWFWPVQTGLGATTLDCIGCVNGQFIAIETKARGKTLTPRQIQVKHAIEDAGGTVIVVDGSVPWDTLRNLILTYGLLD